MRIVQIISALKSGGAERFTVSISNELADQGHQVCLISLMSGTPESDFNRQFLNDQVIYKGLNIKGQSPLKILLQVYSAVNSFNPNVIHCHLGVLQYIFPFALFSHIKILHTLHSLAEHATGGKKWQVKLYRWLYKHNKVIPVTISEECHNSFISYYHLNSDVLIENGCEQAHTTVKVDNVQQEVSEYKPSTNTKVYIHVARYHKAKNQDLLVSAFNQLYSDGYDFILLIIGDGFDSAEGCVLRQKACDRIHFLGGKNNVGDYLACSDFFCLTSIYEGLPISLLEAMSMGVTPICTPVGGMKNVIVDGENGYLSKDLSLEKYVKTVKSSKAIDNKRLKMFFKKNYSMSLCAKRYVSVMLCHE